MESKKEYKWIYLQNRNGFTDKENNLMFTKGGLIRSMSVADMNNYR